MIPGRTALQKFPSLDNCKKKNTACFLFVKKLWDRRKILTYDTQDFQFSQKNNVVSSMDNFRQLTKDNIQGVVGFKRFLFFGDAFIFGMLVTFFFAETTI